MPPQSDDEPGFELITCVRERHVAESLKQVDTDVNQLFMFVFFHQGGGARSQTRCDQGAASGQVGGVSGPRGPREVPRKNQRACFQRGKMPQRQRQDEHFVCFVSLSLSHSVCYLLQGITPSLRKEVWKFLLGFYPWNSTAKEREEILRVKTLVLLLNFPPRSISLKKVKALLHTPPPLFLQGRVFQNEGAVEVGQ